MIEQREGTRMVDPQDYYLKSYAYGAMGVVWVIFAVIWTINCIRFRKVGNLASKKKQQQQQPRVIT